MTLIRLSLFGTPRLAIGEQEIDLPLRKAMALLVYLSVSNEPKSREALATRLWPERDERAARANLRRAIYEIGRRVEVPLLRLEGEKVELDSGLSPWIDVVAFREAAAAGLGDPIGPQLLEEAALLYQADFLEGFTLPDAEPFEEWRFFESESLRQTLEEVLLSLANFRESQGEYSEGIPPLRRLLALDPLNEALHRRLMTLFDANGQRGASLRQYEICVGVLNDELGVEPEPETTQLFESIRTRRQPASPTTSPVTPPKADRQPSVPVPTTPFVGREEELEAILRRLVDPACRLLTLVGPGGIGKTRLALEAARRAQTGDLPDGDRFEDGCCFVPLQQVEEVSNLPAAIADSLDLRLYEDRASRRQLIDFLSGRRMLLVLDNFEQLMDGIDLLIEIGREAPGVKLMVTTRDAIRLRQAWFHPVAGMFYPRRERGLKQPIETYDAIRFFTHCARRARVGFSLEGERTHVVRICQLVEGMPLALELSATWLRALSTADVAAEIEQGLDILRARDRNVPERHRSIRAVFDQSWNRLEPEERRTLLNLSRFRGGCDNDAAREVAQASALTLVSLVDRALVRRGKSDRYEIHELLRQFLNEKIQDIDDGGEFAQRYLHFYLNRLCEVGKELFGRQPQETVRRLRVDLENLRQAWFWAIERREWTLIQAGSDYLAALHEFTGLFHEGSHLFGESIERIERVEPKTNPERQKALIYLHAYHAHFIWFSGNLTRAMKEADRSAELAEEVGDPRARARVALTRTEINDLMGRSAKMLTLAEETVALAVEAGDDRLQAEALNLLSWASYHMQLPDRALESALASSRIFSRTDNRFGLAQSTGYIARAYNLKGSYEQGLEYDRRAYELFEEIGNRLFMAYTASNIGLTYFHSGRLDEALESCYRALDILEELGHKAQQANSLENVGDILTAMGDYASAEKAFRRALEYCNDTGAMLVECGVRSRLGRLLGEQGLEDEAMEMLDEALEQAQQIPDAYLEALSLGERGRLLLRQGDFTAADDAFQTAIPALRRLSRFDLVPYLLAQAELLMARWRLDEAETLLAEVEEIGVGIGRKRNVFRARTMSARILVMNGSVDEARNRLRGLLEEANHPEEEAAIFYELWQLDGEVENRDRAAKLYRSLAANTPNIVYQTRLKQLTSL